MKPFVILPTGLEPLDKGKQTEPARFLEWLGPPPFKADERPTIHGHKSVVEVRDSGNVPGVTGQGACYKTGRVIDKVGDYHFDDLQGEVGGRW